MKYIPQRQRSKNIKPFYHFGNNKPRNKPRTKKYIYSIVQDLFCIDIKESYLKYLIRFYIEITKSLDYPRILNISRNLI